MRDILIQLIAGVILMGMSAIGTGILWIVTRQLRCRRDLNAAFKKIRRLERKLGYDSNACEGSNQPTSEDDY